MADPTAAPASCFAMRLANELALLRRPGP